MWNEVKKFGVQHCDLPTMLGNLSFMLRALALNIDTTYPKPLAGISFILPISLFLLQNIAVFIAGLKLSIAREFTGTSEVAVTAICYVLTALTAACYFYVYFVSMIWFVFVRCRETGDLISAIVVFSLGVSSEIGTSKLVYMFLYNDEIKKIVIGYRECDSLVVHGSRFYNNLMKTLKYVKRRAIIFWTVIVLNGIVYILKPLLLPGRHLMEDSFILYGLEPSTVSPNYEVAFFCMAVGVYFTCYIPANITAFLIVVVGYSEAQMLALSEDLRHLWEDANQHYLEIEDFAPENTIRRTSYNNRVINDYIKVKLEEIIKIHTLNINLVQQIESVFTGAIAIEFTLLSVGLIAELLGGLENTYIELPFALMQVGMDCLTGQRLMDSCIRFEKVVYDCKWENFNKSNMKTVLLMLQNSQKTLTLSAGGITMLSFSCFMSVIRAIYSAYTTLRTTMNN